MAIKLCATSIRGGQFDLRMTTLFGIIGNPVHQVRSPDVFNRLFRERNIDAVMVPFHVQSGQFEAAVRGVRAVENFSGLIVTIPYKSVAAGLLSSCSDRVRLAGVANVLRPVDGGWEGDLFDGEGFAIGLEKRGIHVRGQRCAIVGAGGAGCAIALALVSRGIAELTINDVDRLKIDRLATRLQQASTVPVRVAFPGPETDIAINTTPLGMRADDPLPFDVKVLRQDAIVAEAVMEPLITPLLHAATRHGCRIQEGKRMLDGQIELIWKFFRLGL